jgi:hypothetical protein
MRSLSGPAAGGALSGGDPWAPLRRTALAEARAEADRLRAQAQQRRVARLADARRRAAELREDSLAAAQEAAERDALRTLYAARRSAHELLLAARQEVYADLLREIGERAGGLREDYQAISERLIGEARSRLGEGVEICEAPEGGIIARACGRQIDYSLPTRLGRCLTQLDDEVAALWS